jgi:hypothetical protein
MLAAISGGAFDGKRMVGTIHVEVDTIKNDEDRVFPFRVLPVT